MKYVSRVRSQIKGGCDVALGPKTILVGPNGGGKSTIVQSIELATNGWVSDMEGRSFVKQNKALSRLFPSTANMSVHIEITETTTGKVSDFDWMMKAGPKGSFKTPTHEAPFAVRFPVFDLMATLSGDETTVGSWLEKQVLSNLSTDDILALLPPPVRPDAKDFLDRSAKVDILALAKEASQEAKNLRTQATRTESTVEKMTQGLPLPLPSNRRKDLEDQLRQLQSSSSSGLSKLEYESKVQELNALGVQLATLEGELLMLQPIDPSIAALSAKMAKMLNLIRDHVNDFGTDSCMVCGKDGDMTAYINNVLSFNESLEKDNKTLQRKNNLEIHIKAVQQQYDQRQQFLQSVEVAEDTRNEERDIFTKLAADDSAQRAWHNAEAQKRDIALQRSFADRLTLVAKELKIAGQTFLNQRKASFEKRVSAYLPPGEELGVDLSIARLGILRQGELHSALSGAEEARVLLALASAQEDGSTASVLVPKDRSWHRDTLEEVMKALSDAPAQIIIMTTEEPAPVSGWAIVKVGE